MQGKLQATQIRLAQHYLTKLRSANAAYKRGSESTAHGLRQFEQEWPHIQQWHGWAAARAMGEGAELLSQFSEAGSDLFELRLPPQERIQWLELALMAAQQKLDWPRALKHLGALCRVHIDIGDYPRATELGKQALTLARLLRDDVSTASVLHNLGVVTFKCSDLAVARDYLQQSITLWNTIGASLGLAHALHDLGMITRIAGDYVIAQEYYEQSLAMYRALGSQQGIAHNLNDLGLIAYRDGDYTRAHHYLQQSLDIYQMLGDSNQIPFTLINLAIVLAEQGIYNAAYAHLGRSLELCRTLGYQEGVASAYEYLGRTALLQGDNTAALDYLKQGFQIHISINNPRGMASCYRKFSTIYLRNNEVRKARTALREALDIAARIHSNRLKVDVLVGVIELWVHTGQIRAAAECAGMVMVHPSAWYIDREVIQSLWPQMEAELGLEEALAAVMAGTEGITLEDVVVDVWRIIVSGQFTPLAK